MQTEVKKLKIFVATDVPKACFIVALLLVSSLWNDVKWKSSASVQSGSIWHLLCTDVKCWEVGSQAKEANIVQVSVLLDWSLQLPQLQAKHLLARVSLTVGDAESKGCKAVDIQGTRRLLQWGAGLRVDVAVPSPGKPSSIIHSAVLSSWCNQNPVYFCKCLLIWLLRRRAALVPGIHLWSGRSMARSLLTFLYCCLPVQRLTVWAAASALMLL